MNKILDLVDQIKTLSKQIWFGVIMFVLGAIAGVMLYQVIHQ